MASLTRQAVLLPTLRQTPRAFTLVELSVVIGIIAVLVAILLPVLGRVRVAGRTAACASAQRELLRAGLTRAAGNGGYLPLAGLIVVPSGTSGYDSLPRALSDPQRTRYVYAPDLDASLPTLERPGEGLQALAGFAGTPHGLVCPGRPADVGERPSVSVGTPEMAYFSFHVFTPRGYALNGAFAGFRHDDPTPRHRLRGRLVAARDASNVMWAADSEGEGMWVNHNAYAPRYEPPADHPPTLATFWLPPDDQPQPQFEDVVFENNPRLPLRRHNGRINVAYLDGSVRPARATPTELATVPLAAGD